MASSLTSRTRRAARRIASSAAASSRAPRRGMGAAEHPPGPVTDDRVDQRSDVRVAVAALPVTRTPGHHDRGIRRAPPAAARERREPSSTSACLHQPRSWVLLRFGHDGAMDIGSRLSRQGRPSRDVPDDGSAKAGLARAVRLWREECQPLGKPTQNEIVTGTGVSLGKVKSQLYGEDFLEHHVVLFVARSKASVDQVVEWEQLYARYADVYQREQNGDEKVNRPDPPSWEKASKSSPPASTSSTCAQVLRTATRRG